MRSSTEAHRQRPFGQVRSQPREMVGLHPFSLLQQEKRPSDLLAGAGLQPGDLGGGDRAWHPHWRAVAHPGTRSSGALSAGKWKPQLVLREWKAVETKEWRSFSGETGRESSVCSGSVLLPVDGVPAEAPVQPAVRAGSEGADSLSFILMAFLLFRKGREKAKSFLPDMGPCH